MVFVKALQCLQMLTGIGERWYKHHLDMQFWVGSYLSQFGINKVFLFDSKHQLNLLKPTMLIKVAAKVWNQICANKINKT